MGPFRVNSQLVRRWLIAAVGCTSLTMSAFAGTVIYVDDDAPVGGNGLSWPSAFTHLQDALDFAADRAHGVNEIHIAQGIYRPDRSAAFPLGDRDRNSHFAMLSGVTIRGAYLGLSASKGQDPDTDDVGLYQTILSGDLNGDDEPDSFVNNEENAYQVVVAVDVDGTGVLDSVWVVGGRADGVAYGATPLSRDQGAGINVYFGGPQFLNCQIRNNWNKNHGAVNDHGYTSRYVNCYVFDNYADSFGAGLYFHHDTQCVAEQCQFAFNSTPGQGGGAYSRSMREAHFINCFFAWNNATDGAGLYSAPDSTTVIENCTFDNNTAVHGGGTYLHAGSARVNQCVYFFNSALEGGGIYTDDGSPSITNCLFNGNSGDGGGGGMWNAIGSPIIADCDFVFNTCIDGGGAGIYNGDNGVQSITRCSFFGNTAIEGGGIYNFFADAVITSCTFTENYAVTGSFAVGGGVLNYFCSPTIERCTFTRNSAELGGGGLYNEGESPHVLNCRFNGNKSFSENEGWGGGVMNGYWTQALIANCSFAGNTANQGGGIFNITFARPRIINCTLIGNAATAGAGGIHVMSGALPAAANCLLWGNGPSPIEGDPLPIQFSCIEGGYPGAGNVLTDPMLARLPAPGDDNVMGTSDDDYGDDTIGPGSSCIDAGDDSTVPASVITDLNGHARYVDDRQTPDTGIAANNHPVIDIGAIEYGIAGCAADIAPSGGGGGDGVVNIDDLVLVISNWGTAGGHGPADIAPPGGGDGVVNIDDLLVVINGWGLCP